MGKDSEVFVPFDVAKKKQVVAIAEGGGGREKSGFLATSRTVRCRSGDARTHFVVKRLLLLCKVGGGDEG